MPVSITELELSNLGTVALAAVFGACVGCEREFADKPAGLRTHIFVCAASAMLMLLGNSALDQFQQEGSQYISTDPVRIIQAIVVGISFLGAGTIIHEEQQRVEGLTTAASILFTAGIGIAVAVGQPFFAAGATAMAVFFLVVIGWLERRLR